MANVIFFFFCRKMSGDVRFNPWDVRSLYELQVYDCPECVFQDWSKQSFVDHAAKYHPDSVQYLSNINDDSLQDVVCPWLENTDEKKPFDDPLQENHFCIEYKENEYNLEDPTFDPEHLQQIKIEESVIASKTKECFVALEPLDSNAFDENAPLSNLSGNSKRSLNKVEFIPDDDVLTTQNVKVPKFNKNAKCSYCLMTYGSFQSQDLHDKNCQILQQKICDSCGQQFYDIAELKQHRNQVHVNKFQCEVCLKPFSYNRTLRQHRKNVHNIIDDKPSHLEANKINYDYTDSSVQNTKLEVLDQPQIHNENNETQNIVEEVVDLSEPNMFECGIDQCVKQFSTKKRLNEHKKKVHNGSDWEPETNRGARCNDCLMPYSSFESKELHENNCQTLQQKICDSCGQQFEDFADLEQHRYQAHITMFDCEICMKQFTYEKTLKKHKKKFHSDVLEKEKTRTKSEQSIVDSKEKRCSYCSKTFETTKLLIIHLDELHNDLVYNCLSCEIIFSIAKEKRDHMNTCDEKFKCALCGKEFSDLMKGQFHLKIHIEGVHRKSRHKYTCDQCGDSFTKPGRLKSHTEINHDKVNHAIPCEICGKTYRHEHLLKKHIKNYHKKGPKFIRIFAQRTYREQFLNFGARKFKNCSL